MFRNIGSTGGGRGGKVAHVLTRECKTEHKANVLAFGNLKKKQNRWKSSLSVCHGAQLCSTDADPASPPSSSWMIFCLAGVKGCGSPPAKAYLVEWCRSVCVFLADFVAFIYLLFAHSRFSIRLQLHDQLQLLGDLWHNCRAFDKQRFLFKGRALQWLLLKDSLFSSHNQSTQTAPFHPSVTFDVYSEILCPCVSNRSVWWRQPVDDTGQQTAEAYRPSGAEGGVLSLDLFKFLLFCLSSSSWSHHILVTCVLSKISKWEQRSDTLPTALIHKRRCRIVQRYMKCQEVA